MWSHRTCWRRWSRALLLAAALALPALPAAAGEVVAGPVPARVLAVVDGDTLRVRARVWLGQDVETAVRLAGVDAPELGGGCALERATAEAARRFVVERLGAGEVALFDIGHDKYGGRVIARVEAAGLDLGAALIDAGLARAYDGGARPGWCEAAAAE